jgi:hypothetical protein
MLAERENDLSDSTTSSWRSKPWEVTKVEGYLAWKLRVDAIIAGTTELSAFVNVDFITESMCARDVPGFSSMSPVERVQVVTHFTTAHEKLCNAAYAKVLASIDLSKDTTLMRKIHSDYAPRPGKRPAQIWRLIDELAARGDRGLRTNQIAIEQRVADWKIPFGTSAPELARSFLTFVSDWHDLDINAGASPRLLVRAIVSRMREGGAHWQMHASQIELDAAKDIKAFADMPALIMGWEQTIFVFFASKDAEAPIVAPVSPNRACSGRSSTPCAA